MNLWISFPSPEFSRFNAAIFLSSSSSLQTSSSSQLCIRTSSTNLAVPPVAALLMTFIIVSLLYAVIKNNHDIVFTTWQKCLRKMMTDGSWKDSSPTLRLTAVYQSNLSGITVFRTLSTVLLQLVFSRTLAYHDVDAIDRYFNRYKDAIRNNADVPAFVQQFADWFKTWADDVSATPPRFEDPISSVPSNNRKLMINHVREDIDRLIAIAERETGLVQRVQRGPTISTVTDAQRSQARTAQLMQTYNPPGSLREDGPRHDNDFTEIEHIRIAPTHDELLCAVPPYLPVFNRDAPHHWPADSMQRHLDIQFRLLREELMYVPFNFDMPLLLTSLSEVLPRARPSQSFMTTS